MGHGWDAVCKLDETIFACFLISLLSGEGFGFLMGSWLGSMRGKSGQESESVYAILFHPDGDYELLFRPVASPEEVLTVFHEHVPPGPSNVNELQRLKCRMGNKGEYLFYFCRYSLYDMEKPENKWFAPYRGSFLLLRQESHPVTRPLALARLPRDEIQSVVSFFWMQLYLSIIHPSRGKRELKIRLGLNAFEDDEADFVELLNLYREKHGVPPFDVDGIPYKREVRGVDPPRPSGRRMRNGERPILFRVHASRLLTNKSVEKFVAAPVVFLD